MKKLRMMFLVCTTFSVLMQCKEDEEVLARPEVAELQAEAGIGYVILTWTLPADVRVSEYTLTYSPGGVPITIPGDQRTYTVPKLSAGTLYMFTIKTKNSAGALSSGVSVEASTLRDNTVPDTWFKGNLEAVFQDELDNFDSKYTYIDGDVVITGPDITDLSNLANVDTISGKLEIYFNDNLESLQALSKLKYVGNNLYIRANVKLADLGGLGNLTYIGKDLSILGLPLITDLDGLSALENVNGSMYIGTEAWKTPPVARPNELLGDFCGIKNLLAGGGLAGELHIANNKTNPTRQDIISGSCTVGSTLPDVADFAVAGGDGKVTLTWTTSSDAAVTGYELTWSPGGNAPINIAKDQGSYTVTGLTNGTTYSFTLKTTGSSSASSQGVTVVATPSAEDRIYSGSLTITSQAALDALPELYTVIEGTLHIQGADITDLSKLAALRTVSGKFEIVNCTSLTSVSAFGKLTSVGHNFYIQNNPMVTSLEGFHNLLTIARDITILQMTGLTNLDGLRSLEAGRNLYIGVEGWLTDPPADKGNTQLNDLCGIKHLLQSSPGLAGTYYVANNASNPTREEIISQCQ